MVHLLSLQAGLIQYVQEHLLKQPSRTKNAFEQLLMEATFQERKMYLFVQVNKKI
jgi:hypothetical protein